MSSATATKDNNTPAKVEGNVSTIVLKQVQKLQEARTLFLPGDYSPENALRSAWFFINNSDQKEKILACTPESQINALYDMVIQALDVSKKQAYFIPYGTRLVLQRSYFGDIAVAKRVRPGIEVYHDVIYEGETIKVRKEVTRYGYVTRIEHDPSFPREQKSIIGAYCGVFDENGEHMGVELMDMDQIKTSWKKSKTYGEKSATFHNEQPDIACQRTVIRRRLKPIINASNDAALLESVRRQEIDASEAQMDDEVAANANGQIIKIPALDPRSETTPVPTLDPPAALSESDLRSGLNLNDDQWTYLGEGLAAKSDKPLTLFLTECAADGCKDYKSVSARLEALPDREAPQQALMENPGY
jgi:recombination protein RecT